MKLAKVCVLGEASVGKTSLIRRFVDRSFSDSYLSTVGVKISRKLMSVQAPETDSPLDLQLVLWDLEGGPYFSAVSASYLRGARAAIIVGDLTRQDTLDVLPSHADQFLTINPHGVVLVALNKSDLSHPGGSATDVRLERSEVAIVQKTSAKNGRGVDDLFHSLGTYLIREWEHGPRT